MILKCNRVDLNLETISNYNNLNCNSIFSLIYCYNTSEAGKDDTGCEKNVKSYPIIS